MKTTKTRGSVVRKGYLILILIESIHFGISFLVLHWLGFEKALVVMTIASLVVGYFCIHYYDRSKQDWLAFESMKKGEAMPEIKYALFRWIVLCAKKGPLLVFVFLMNKNPAIIILYFRKEEHLFKGIPGWKMWVLFFLVAFTWNMWILSALYEGFSLAPVLWEMVVATASFLSVTTLFTTLVIETLLPYSQ